LRRLAEPRRLAGRFGALLRAPKRSDAPDDVPYGVEAEAALPEVEGILLDVVCGAVEVDEQPTRSRP
jgi:hypothetical protein